MSAMKIATETLPSGKHPNAMRPLFEALKEKYDSLPPVEEMLQEEEFTCHFIKPSKKKTSSPEERIGIYNEDRCDARIWKEKPKSGGLGYDNIQCSAKKIGGSCFCKRHGKTFEAGALWVGKINEPRPEPPTKPDGTVMGWSTDSDGNEVVKEKKKRKTSQVEKKEKKERKSRKKKSLEEMKADLSIDELKKLLEEREKEAEEKKGEEGGIGAGTGLEDEKVEKDEKDEEEAAETITVDGVEYQHDKDNHVLTRCSDFEEVGKWNTETEEIDFYEEDEDDSDDE
tara:strand:+ start:13186 stop:14037 length:852 start_codon:yes stop_codon:yes gene_type:complete